MKMKDKISTKQKMLIRVGSRLNSKRDKIMDKINSLLEFSENTAQIQQLPIEKDICKLEIKLAQVEQAINLNNHFMRQIQEDAALKLIELANLISEQSLKNNEDKL